ncbi:unnamed protein product [Periconia digitata]|uniref:leucine--tRNA ligase n=1 Tax=Periconia digitata TaxID=1303443 RepID=A0A9W4XJL8_9PLEO|nr:unnamed protein product [Periconia digitata]
MRTLSLHPRGVPCALHVHRFRLRCPPWAISSRSLGSKTASDSNIETHDLPALTKKWQPFWDRDAGAKPPNPCGKAYILPMFPYPSGTLHLGHLRVYTISDVLARVKRMMGYNVLHPIGWDAFGLPAENAAIERHVHPADWTARNIETMKSQMMAMGGQWDWDKEFRTCDPEFYKHTQRLFLMLHQQGLAYQAESLVNWDPVDHTVLANEQVDADGCSWRSGAKVEKKKLKQWFLKITDFKLALLQDLDTLAEKGGWPERVIAMQKNWIGHSSGASLKFHIRSKLPPDFNTRFPSVKRRLRNSRRKGLNEPIHVFTTRADTLFGVQYLALSLEHPVVAELARKDKKLRKFVKGAKSLPPDTKEGYLLSSIEGTNPLQGLTTDPSVTKPIPVFVAPYVLSEYGSGAVMGVPGHDARDHAFWRRNEPTSPVKYVITPSSSHADAAIESSRGPVVEKGYVVTTDHLFAGLSSEEAILKVVEKLQNKQRAVATSNWRLRDWLISRQRYWGTPIPIVHCGTCGAVPVPVEDLPVKLPDLPASYFDGRNGNPLEHDEEWKKTQCPQCNGPAHRETDTMDTFMDSSWYFFRFLDSKNPEEPFKPALADQGMPVDIYVGGVEHAILHLLYARFITKFLASRLWWPKGKRPDTGSLGEPFKQLVTQGMVHGKTYTHPKTGRFLRPDELDLNRPAHQSSPYLKDSDLYATVSYEKMSKSKYNGVDPASVIDMYGADVTRAHMLFQAPINEVLEWDEVKITGAQRWLKRMLKLSTAFWYPENQPGLYKFTPPTSLDCTELWLEQCIHAGLLVQPSNQVNRDQKLSQQNHEGLLRLLDSREQDLLAKLHKTIASVTKSYTETHSLNTVVSDLMELTNHIWQMPNISDASPVIRYMATLHLLRLAAPIAPAVAEEGWHLLHARFNGPVRDQKGHPLHAIRTHEGPSIFSFGFPAYEDTIVRLKSAVIPCVFQVNGKNRFHTEIRKFEPEPVTADTVVDAQQRRKQEVEHVLAELLKTERGKEWLDVSGEGKLWAMSEKDRVGNDGEEHDEFPGVVPPGWNVFVAKSGGMISFAKKKKGNKVEEKTGAEKEKE